MTKELKQVGTWNTPTLQETFNFDPEIKNAWWYDFIPIITDEEFAKLIEEESIQDELTNDEIDSELQKLKSKMTSQE